MKKRFHEHLNTLIEWSLELSFISFVTYLAIKCTSLNPTSPRDLAIAFLIAALIVKVFKFLLSVKPTTILYGKVKNLYYSVIGIINKTPLITKRYTVEERSTEKYKEAIKEQFASSKRIYFRLLSAHTMFYDDKEKFIVNLLRKLSVEDIDDKRDIKIQLLDRSSSSFDERANNYINLMDLHDLPYKCSYQEYMTRCKKIENALIRIVGIDNVSFYSRRYLWRLYIFDNNIFVSTYSDKPEFIEGHLSTAYSFNRDCDVSLFDGFLEEFNSLYKKTQNISSSVQPATAS